MSSEEEAIKKELDDMSTGMKRMVPIESFPPKPIPMILHCPECSMRHLDVGEFATKPHATHACQHCGFVWRPAVVNTVGVQFLPGFKNEKETENGS